MKCDNTLDARLNLVYEELQPQIRASLFPSSIKEAIVHEAYESDDEGEPSPDEEMWRYFEKWFIYLNKKQRKLRRASYNAAEKKSVSRFLQ